MYKYILFDLDGTLTDPKEGICKSVQYALHKYNIEENDIDKLEPFIGPPLIDSFMKFYAMDEPTARQAVEYYRERFSVVGLYENEVYSGIPEMLKKLKDDGIRLAIASSKPTVFVEKILSHFGIDKYFDVVVGSELDGTRTKKEEVVEEALLSLFFGQSHDNRQLSECDEWKKDTVMVGDRSYDVEGAKAVNIKSIGVDYGYAAPGELKKAGADYIAKTVRQLEVLLTGENKPQNNGKRSNGQRNSASDTACDKAGDVKKDTSWDGKSSFEKTLYILTPFALYMALSVAISYLGIDFYFRFAQGGMSEEVCKGIFAMVATACAGLAMILFYGRSDKLPINLSGVSLLTGIDGLLLGLGANLILGYVIKAFPGGENLLQDAGAKAELPIALGTLFYVLISPIAEELLFRYMIYGRICKLFGTKIAILFSALFFGLYHGNLIQGIYAFIMGVIMALIMYYTNSITATAAFHICHNAVVYWGPMLPEKVGNILSTVPSAIISTLLGIFLVYVIGKNAKNKNAKNMKCIE